MESGHDNRWGRQKAQCQGLPASCHAPPPSQEREVGMDFSSSTDTKDVPCQPCQKINCPPSSQVSCRTEPPGMGKNRMECASLAELEFAESGGVLQQADHGPPGFELPSMTRSTQRRPGGAALVKVAAAYNFDKIRTINMDDIATPTGHQWWVPLYGYEWTCTTRR